MSRPKRWLIAVAALALAGCAPRQLMPTPNLYVCGDGDPFADVPPALRVPEVDLLYVTDRDRVEGGTGAGTYGWDRSASLAYGSCIVSLGSDLSWDQLVHESTVAKRTRSMPMSIGTVTEMGRFAPTPLPVIRVDGELMLDPDAVHDANILLAKFYEELGRRLALTPRKEVYVFVHGYRNTFEDAAFALAELWHFLGREGVPILYTWPAGSPGLLRGYTHDRESGEFTIFHLKALFRALGGYEGVGAVNIIAHSRGTDVATSALRELVLESRRCGDPRSEYKFSRVVLAAPDLDFDVVTQRIVAERLGEAVASGSNVYVSATDKAISIADWLFNSDRRIGQLRPEDIDPNLWESIRNSPRMAIIDARVRRADKNRHSYFRTNPACSSDVILYLRYGRDAGSSQRPLERSERGFWILDDETYPCPQVPGR